MAAKTVALANTKGGVGKSTMAVHLAEWFRRQGQRTILVDTDKQASAASWVVWRKTEAKEHAPEITRLYAREILTQVPDLQEKYDRIVIDTRGADGEGTRAALIVADLAVVPVRDSDFDSAAIDDLIGVMQDIRPVNPKLVGRAFLSQIDSRRSFPKDVADYLDEVGLHPFEQIIRHRAAFTRAARGLAVFDMPDVRARVEMSKLCEEINHELV